MPFTKRHVTSIFEGNGTLCTEGCPVRNSPCSSDLQQTDMSCLKRKEAFSYSDTYVKVCFSDVVANLFVLWWGPDLIFSLCPR